VEGYKVFWGVQSSWCIKKAKNKSSLNQEHNQAPQPTTRARVRLGLGFKVVIIYRYALEKVLSVDCINNLQKWDDCYLDHFYKLRFLWFRLQTRVRAKLGLGFKVVII